MAGPVTGAADLDQRQDLAKVARSGGLAALDTLLAVHRAGTYGVALSGRKTRKTRHRRAGLTPVQQPAPWEPDGPVVS